MFKEIRRQLKYKHKGASFDNQYLLGAKNIKTVFNLCRIKIFRKEINAKSSFRCLVNK